MKEDIKKLKKWYGEELERKDKQIEDLKKEAVLLLKTSLNHSKKIDELTEKLKKTIKKETI